MDLEDIKLGQSLEELGNEAINSCSMFVALVTKKSNKHEGTFQGRLHTLENYKPNVGSHLPPQRGKTYAPLHK